MMYDCDVLIIGAGPVGTTLALELALHGVDFRVIEKHATRSNQSRALVVQPRTLELLNRHGAAEEIVSRGTRARGAALHVNRKFVSNVDFEDIGLLDTEFTLPLFVSQAETERFLDDCLAKYGKAVERPCVAKSLLQDDDAVTTTVEHLGSNGNSTRTETIRSRYVVGCDGANSFVRRSSENLKFEGAAYPQDFILCDAHLRDSSLFPDRLNTCLGMYMLGVIPLGNDIYRFIVTGRNIAGSNSSSGANSEDAERASTGRPAVPQLEQFQAALDELGPPGAGTIHDPIWQSRFYLHHRGVNSYRDRRLFLAGDAAHIHSPAGGQGMNTGMQDAINLGWKLAAAISGKHLGVSDTEAILDSYHQERYPVGQQLLHGTDRVFSLVAEVSPVILRVRNFILPWVSPWLARSWTVRRWMFDFVSELGISYRTSASPLVGTGKSLLNGAGGGVVHGGDRLPDGRLIRLEKTQDADDQDGEKETRVQKVCVGARYHLLLCSGKADGDVGASVSAIQDVREKVQSHVGENGILETHSVFYFSGNPSTAGDIHALLSPSSGAWYLDRDGEVHGQLGFKERCGYVLVRPDGYVAHIGLLADVTELLGFLG